MMVNKKLALAVALLGTLAFSGAASAIHKNPYQPMRHHHHHHDCDARHPRCHYGHSSSSHYYYHHNRHAAHGMTLD